MKETPVSSEPIPIIRRPRRVAGSGGSSTAALIMLGLAAKELRERAGLTQTALAKAIHVSNSTICRLEAARAENPPERRTVEAVLGHLRASPEKRAEMLSLLSRALEPEWYQHRYSDCTPDHLRRLLGLESMAISLTTYEARLVPGLLQSPGYTRCVVLTGLHLREWDSPEVESRLAQRRERQARVLGQDDPPRCVFLMDESVLYRRVGADEVMREQMEHLRELAAHPHITLRFVLLDRMIAGNAGTMAGSMTHLVFGRGSLPDLVYVEGYEKADYHSKPARSAEERARPWPVKENEFERHLQLLLRLQGEACASPAKSRLMLDDAVRRYT
ncbi:helix-turn-helix domain-containing protein [Streptomyces fradiae]|uniref:helix-turn-helix domain-containing protein n=2 Tax=Streptomyces fradiae TaxID=1906 RepID=UPI0036609BE2